MAQTFPQWGKGLGCFFFQGVRTDPGDAMKCYTAIFCLSAVMGMLRAQDAYVGTSLGFADYLEKRCGIVFRENGQPRDPFLSIASHGATIIRVHVGHPPYSSSYSEGQMVDHHSEENAKVSMQRAKAAGLKTLLTFTYQSFALEDQDNLNIYVAPLNWQPVASDLGKISDSVYAYTYSVLDEYCAEGLVPEIVSIGAESTWHRLMPNVPENELPEYDPARSVALHNAGSRAVRDIAQKYDTLIKVCFHMRGPSVTKWWLETHWPYGPDFDIIGISLYYGWNFDDYAGYNSLGDYVAGIIDTYGIEFLVMETAQMFREGGNDGHVDILGTDLIPYGYPNPPTTETQKSYLTDITNEVLDHGGSGVIFWGGDWVGSDCYIYADRWGKGSSWENKTFWDFDYNLHDGVNWMMAFSGKVPVTFKVDMSPADTSRGVFISGDFENFNRETWVPNRMHHEGEKIYYYTAYINPGTTGEFHFLNDTLLTAGDTVPAECSAGAELNRRYEIPANSSGETLAFLWSACDTVAQYSLSTTVKGKGFTSPVSGVYSSGIPVDLVARPELGWRFENWTGDTSSSANPLLLQMHADLNLTANFSKLSEVPLTFKVDMTGVDVSNGVYVTGDFPGQDGKTWQLNPMYTQGGNIYSYSTEISIGSAGAYYFLNDDQWGVRERVPVECAVHWGSDRGFEIPLNSSGEVFAFVWSSCKEIPPASASGPVSLGHGPLAGIFPNPVSGDKLNISFYVADEVDIRILDVSGNACYMKAMKTNPGSTHSIELYSFTQGVYMLSIFFHGRRICSSGIIIIPGRN